MKPRNKHDMLAALHSEYEKYAEAAANMVTARLDENEGARPTPNRIDRWQNRVLEGIYTSWALTLLTDLIACHERDDIPEELQDITRVNIIVNLLEYRNGQPYKGARTPAITKHGAGEVCKRLVQLNVQAEETARKAFEGLELERNCYLAWSGSVKDFYPTPDEVINRMLMHTGARADAGQIILEPSAGMGHIWSFCKNLLLAGNEWRLIEINHQYLRPYLHHIGAPLLDCDDFLQYHEWVDHILMNPPFENFADSAHIRHAWDILKPGGTLVSVCGAAAIEGRKMGHAKHMPDWLASNSFTWQELPRNSFANNTVGVKTYIVWATKPATQVPPLEPQPVEIAPGITVTQHGDPAVELAAKEQTAIRNGSGITGAIGSEIRYEGYRLKAALSFGMRAKCAAFYAPSNVLLATIENLPADQWEPKIVELVAAHKAGQMQRAVPIPPSPRVFTATEMEVLSPQPAMTITPEMRTILDRLTKIAQKHAIEYVPELITWLRTYKDGYKRDWTHITDVAAHESSTHWRELTSKWRNEGRQFDNRTLKAAIKIAILQLQIQTEPPPYAQREWKTVWENAHPAPQISVRVVADEDF